MIDLTDIKIFGGLIMPIPNYIKQSLSEDRLTDLYLRDLTNEDANELAELIKGKSKLTKIDLSYNNFNLDSVSLLAQAFEQTKISTLYFNRIGPEGLGDEGLKILLKSLIKITSLATVSLWSNFITDGSSELLAAFVKAHPAITELDLYANQLADNGITTIFNAIKHNANFHKINLGNNKFSLTVIEIIIETIRNKNYRLNICVDSKYQYELNKFLLDDLQKHKEIVEQKDAAIKTLKNELKQKNEASTEVTILKTNLTRHKSSFSDEANEISTANVRLSFFK